MASQRCGMLLAVCAVVLLASLVPECAGRDVASGQLRFKRGGSLSLECTAKCADYWKCRAKGFLVFGSCKYPRGCKCNCFFWQDC